MTCSDTTDGQNRLAENFGTVRASAPVSSAVTMPYRIGLMWNIGSGASTRSFGVRSSAAAIAAAIRRK